MKELDPFGLTDSADAHHDPDRRTEVVELAPLDALDVDASNAANDALPLSERTPLGTRTRPTVARTTDRRYQDAGVDADGDRRARGGTERAVERPAHPRDRGGRARRRRGRRVRRARARWLVRRSDDGSRGADRDRGRDAGAAASRMSAVADRHRAGGARTSRTSGHPFGPTPVKLKVTAGTKLDVKIELAGYRTYEDGGVLLQPGGAPLAESAPRLERAPATLHVSSDPVGAEVYDRGRAARDDADRLSSSRRATGTGVTIAHAGYTAATATVDLVAGETANVQRTLKAIARVGYVVIKCPSCWANVSFKGKAVGHARAGPPRSGRCRSGRQTLQLDNLSAGKSWTMGGRRRRRSRSRTPTSPHFSVSADQRRRRRGAADARDHRGRRRYDRDAHADGIAGLGAWGARRRRDSPTPAVLRRDHASRLRRADRAARGRGGVSPRDRADARRARRRRRHMRSPRRHRAHYAACGAPESPGGIRARKRRRSRCSSRPRRDRRGRSRRRHAAPSRGPDALRGGGARVARGRRRSAPAQHRRLDGGPARDAHDRSRWLDAAAAKTEQAAIIALLAAATRDRAAGHLSALRFVYGKCCVLTIGHWKCAATSL